MTKYYYNGVLLPEIPQDVLAEYPYCWIRYNITSGNYDLLFGKQPWYYANNMSCQDSSSLPWYIISVNGHKDVTEWTYNKTSTGAFTVDNTRLVLWSNHDIPNGSATSTNKYFDKMALIPYEDSQEPSDPKNYTKLTYIESTGTQYIDTGVFASPYHYVEVAFMVSQLTANWDTVFGARDGSNSRFTVRFKNSEDGSLGLQYSSAGAGTATIYESPLTRPTFTDTFHTIKFNKNVVYVDGITVKTFDSPKDMRPYPYDLFLFANNNVGTAGDFAYIRVAYCKIWQNDLLVRDFTPVLDENRVACMYDTVSNEYFYNSGTDTFLAGAVASADSDDKFYGMELIGSLSTLTSSREAGYTFTVNEDITMTGFRLYTPTAMTNITCRLWNSSKEIIASALALQSKTNTWVEVNLDKPVDLIKGQSYTISCWIPNNRYSSALSSIITSSSITITTGCYNATEGSFPSTTGTNVYQLIDIIYMSMFDRKYLIRCNSTLYTVVNNTLIELEATYPFAYIFREYGFDEAPDWSVISQLANPELLYWQDVTTVDPQLTVNMTATPISQNVITNAIDLTDPTITGIELMTVNCEGNPLFAVSFDDKATWYAWNGTEWSLVSEEFSGMTRELLESITYDQWMLLYEGASSFYIRVSLSTLEDKLTEIYVDFAN